MAENQTNMEVTAEAAGESPPQTGCNGAAAREACTSAVMQTLLILMSNFQHRSRINNPHSELLFMFRPHANCFLATI